MAETGELFWVPDWPFDAELIRLTRQAEQDIDEILAYIAADNLDTALSFNDRLTQLFETLANNEFNFDMPLVKEYFVLDCLLKSIRF